MGKTKNNGLKMGKNTQAACSYEATVGLVEEPVSKVADGSSIKGARQVFGKMPERKAVCVSSESDSVSHSLGTKDTSSDRVSVKDYTSSMGDEEEPPVGSNVETKAATPWVNLFRDNRLPSKGLSLEHFKLDDAEHIVLEEDDIQQLESAWGHCLIGYVVGRFPVKKALLDCCNRWGVQYTYSNHDSGWLIFKFNSEEDRTTVLANGSYFIFQRPFLLKVMPTLFDFGEEELYKFSVWVKMRNLPLELWNPAALGKILSKVGTLIRTDQLTASKGSISFAKALVEVDA